jgi:hypothetical protein
MVQITGGWVNYQAAFRDLWLFNTGHNSVFEKGLPAFIYYSSTTLLFIAYGLGAGVPVVGLALYSAMRGRRPYLEDKAKSLFLAAWMLPALLFHLLIFNNSSNPGYILIVLPALLLITAESIGYLGDELFKLTGRDFRVAITTTVITANIGLFFFVPSFISYQWIRDHDKNLSLLLDKIVQFPARTTALFVRPYAYYGYRQIMYYLPEYRVYSVDVIRAPSGEVSKTFWGEGHKTFLTDEIDLPKGYTDFAAIIMDAEDKMRVGGHNDLKIKEVGKLAEIVTGPVSLLKVAYPELRLKRGEVAD